MEHITSIFDLEAKARERLPAVLFDYVHGGSEQELTLQRNLDDMRALALRQHTLRDVSARETSVTMVGDAARIPLAIGPTGLAGLTWPNGEEEEARAAADFGVPYCLSTMSICSIEDVAAATGKPFWCQLYLMKARRVNESLIRRAHEANCSALVLTLDLHVQGKRWADAKNGLSVPPRLTPSNLFDMAGHPGKAIGRGAHACLSGRACLYGLAANGRDGVACALKLFEDELNDCMALAGLQSVRRIEPGVVTVQPSLDPRQERTGK